MSNKIKGMIKLLMVYFIAFTVFLPLYQHSTWNSWNWQAWVCFVWIVVPMVFLVALAAKYGSTSDWSITLDLVWGAEPQEIFLAIALLPCWPLITLLLLAVLVIDGFVQGA